MKSITKHLCITQLILLIVATSLFCTGLYQYVSHILVQDFDSNLEEQASALSQMVQIHDRHEGHDEHRGGHEREHGKEKPIPPTKESLEIDENALDEFNQGHASSYFIFDHQGKLISKSPRASIEDIQSIPLVTGQSEIKQRTADIKTANGQNLRYIQAVFRPRTGNEHTSQKQWSIIVLRDQSGITSTLETLLRGCLLCGILLVSISSLLSVWNVRKGLAPLTRIASEVDALDATQLEYRFNTDQLPTELSHIADKLNDLLERLQKAFLRERSFAGSAAHELRTPLAELKAIAQVGASWTQEDTNPDFPTQYFKDSEAIVQRMQSLIVALLTLIQDDPECVDINWTEVSLTDEVNRAIQTLLPQQNRSGQQRVKLIAPDDIQVLADPGLLDGILTNILNNAVEYADDDTDILCEITTHDNCVRLTLKNHCQDIQQEDIEKMTEAFWRKDPSRSGTDHQGLGISLAQTYARCMACTLTVTYQQDHQILVTLDGLESTTIT